MTPKQIAQKVLNSAREKAKHPEMLHDELIKEIAQALSEERELISKYLQFLNESIAFNPALVRHRLLAGSTRLSSGCFVEDMNKEEHQSYHQRLNPIRHRYYGV